MKLSYKNIRWVRIINTSLIAFAVSYFILVLVIMGFALTLAVQARGNPDQAAINQFAASVSIWLMPLAEILLTIVCTVISTKKIEKDVPINGLMMGILVGVFAVILKLVYGGVINFHTAGLFFILCFCGWLSGVFVQRRRTR